VCVDNIAVMRGEFAFVRKDQNASAKLNIAGNKQR